MAKYVGIVTLRDGRTVQVTRGRSMAAGTPLKRGGHRPWLQEVDGFKVGDRVRVLPPHYEAGTFTEGTIIGLWDNGSGPDVCSQEACDGLPKDQWPVIRFTGAVVRHHLRDLVKLDYAGDGMAKFEDGGYALSNLEKIV